ncbi:MAG: phosphatidate cytidylyltransferase [Hyphomicrobium sp.]
MSDRDAGEPVPQPSLIPRELQLRLISGAVVGALALLAIWIGPLVFGALVMVIAAVMAWEWGRIVRGDGFDIVGLVHIASTLAAGVLAMLGMAGLAIAAVMVGALTALALLFASGPSQLSSVGVVYTGLPLIALIWLRSDGAQGFWAVLFILVTVVITDTAAYATGRTIGGPKLWPAVSPGKTWSGLAGGVTASGIGGALFALLSGTGWWPWLAFLGVVLAVVAQGGDLAESALKRHFNLKDASDLIPGHGGFMDRMDGVVTAAVAAALIGLAVDAYAPARAVLYGS